MAILKMLKMRMLVVASLIAGASFSAQAVPFYWTDWTSASNTNGITVNGTITTLNSTVNVTYNNPLGVGFTQLSGGTDYWTNGPRNPANSPYTSALVDNIPTGTDIIALQFAGSQTLTFSQAVANPVFSFVSLNGNGYAFLDQDFDILSVSGVDGNACGFWGCGTVTKNVVDLGNGHTEYQLIGSGEPHGTIRFAGAFNTVGWRSLSNEFWNGFTVGVQGTAQEVFNDVPEPESLLLVGLGLLGLAISRQQKKHN